MDPIVYIDRITQKKEIETVFGASVLRFLYGNSLFSKTIGKALLKLVSKNPAFSKFYGWWQNRYWTKRSIAPFIQKFNIDSTEFALAPEAFTSFNDFFIRHLKKEVRPIAPGSNVAVMPADARYLFYPHIGKADGFIVKGEKFQLADLLGDPKLAQNYEQGAMLIARLCPSDYHRFHFPVDCVPSPTRSINGWLYSVNPVALKKNIEIFSQNKRAITQLATREFGTVLFIEIGATNVGSIVQTYRPYHFYPKGEEKGYFSFGASSLIILFPQDTIEFDSDLIRATEQNFEIKCLLGQSLGKSTLNFSKIGS
ncbi:MAG: phosphatidylserine decarboxylase [Parachlamydiaceae bacterium]